jgi:hypothetical protein
MVKPHPFAMLGVGLSSGLTVYRDPTTIRQPGYLSPRERPIGFAPPPHGRFAFIAAPERQSAHGLWY